MVMELCKQDLNRWHHVIIMKIIFTFGAMHFVNVNSLLTQPRNGVIAVVADGSGAEEAFDSQTVSATIRRTIRRNGVVSTTWSPSSLGVSSEIRSQIENRT